MSDARLLSEHTEGLSHHFQLRLDDAAVRERVDAELKKVAGSARLPGFRPGKVPLAMLRKRFGPQVREAAVDRLAIGVARGLIAERSLQPISRPRIRIDDDSAAAVTFNLQVEVAPRIEIGEVGGYELQRLHCDPPDAELEQEAELLLRRELFDAMMARYDFPVPAAMVDSERARLVRGFEQEVGEAVDESLLAELQAVAERRVRLAILLTEIGSAHGVSVPREEVDELLEREVELDPDHRAEIVDYYLDHPTALAELQSPLFEDRVVDFVLSRSRVEDVTLPAAELEARLEAT